MDHQIQTVKIYNQHVEEYLNKFLHFDLYNDTFNDLLKLIPLNGNVLELGCGPGNVIKYFLEKRPDLNILGVDLAPEMLKKAEELNPKARFKLLDIRYAECLVQKYDAVVGAFCLPYLSFEDLDIFFKNLNRLTNKDSLIYLSCMEGNKDKSGFEKTSFTGDQEIYIYYHQKENIESKLLKNQFVIEKFYVKDYPESDGSFTTDLIYIARRK